MNQQALSKACSKAIIASERTFRRRLLAAIHHPHHFITAGALTAIFFAIGETESAIKGAWLYALIESMVAGEPHPPEPV